MTRVATEPVTPTTARVSQRANRLAERLEQGAHALHTLARGLTDAQWATPMPKDGRSIGVIVHHVASVYPVEIHLAQIVANGDAITSITNATVDEMNGGHAQDFRHATKAEALALLAANSAAAAEAIRALSDEQLDRAALVSLYSDAPLTCQFVLEDHAVRHSYHHLAKIRRALNL